MAIQSRKESTRRVKFDGSKVRIVSDDSLTLVLEFKCLELPESAHKELDGILKNEFKFDDVERGGVHAQMETLLLRKLVNSAITN